MLLIASKVLASSVALNGQKIKITRLLVDSKTGRVSALSLENQTIFTFDYVLSWEGLNIILKSPKIRIASSAIQDSISIIKHKVQTENGISLGILQDFEFESSLGEIITYKVRLPLIGTFLPKPPLIINRSQVIAIKKEKIIVQDNLIKIKAQIKNWHPQKGILSAGANASSIH